MKQPLFFALMLGCFVQCALQMRSAAMGSFICGRISVRRNVWSLQKIEYRMMPMTPEPAMIHRGSDATFSRGCQANEKDERCDRVQRGQVSRKRALPIQRHDQKGDARRGYHCDNSGAEPGKDALYHTHTAEMIVDISKCHHDHAGGEHIPGRGDDGAGTPATCVPTKVAELIAIGPGVIWRWS